MMTMMMMMMIHCKLLIYPDLIDETVTAIVMDLLQHTLYVAQYITSNQITKILIFT
jgi:hypothetical protein